MDSISSRTISNRYEKKEYYNLNFEGDQYLLSKWYPKLKKPTPIRIEKSQIHTLPKCENDWTTCQSFISKDSIRYLFHQQCYSNKNVIFKRVQTFARYKGKTQELEKALEEKYNKYRGVSLTDSACLFRSFSQVDGTLKKIQLLAGEKNKFSDFIKKEIEILSISKGWIPRIVSSGRQVKSYLKIYARLNKDKSITFSTSDGY